MDRFEVNIYIETSIHGPARRPAVGEYYMEYIKKDGSPETRNAVIREEMTTENALALELLQAALERLTRPCSVRVNTGCGHILNVMNRHLLSQWEKAGWVTAKGRLIKNMALWQHCQELMRGHTVTFESGPHSYRMRMLWEIEKEQERFYKELEKQEEKTEKNVIKTPQYGF